MLNQNKNITADNIVEELRKQVKHYEVETNYGFRYTNTQFFFELNINDRLVLKKSTSSTFPINANIFKKGI